MGPHFLKKTVQNSGTERKDESRLRAYDKSQNVKLNVFCVEVKKTRYILALF